MEIISLTDLPHRQNRESIFYPEMIISFNSLTNDMTITETLGFKLVYSTRNRKQHFKVTKQILPLELMLKNRVFISELSKSEPAKEINVRRLEEKLMEIKSKNEHQDPEAFALVTELVAIRNAFIESAAHFVSYDTWYHVAKRFYEPSADMELLQLFPPTEPSYVHEATVHADETYQAFLTATWTDCRDKANEAAKHYAQKKNDAKVRSAIERIEVFHRAHYLEKLRETRASESKRRADLKEKYPELLGPAPANKTYPHTE